MRNALFALATVLLSSEGLAAPSECIPFAGAIIVSDKGEYLGRLTSEYDSASIFNKYGTFGSKYNSKSIWNRYGSYGSPYSAESAFNKYTTSPPLVVKDGKALARLTTNTSLGGAIDPLVLSVVCFGFRPDD